MAPRAAAIMDVMHLHMRWRVALLLAAFTLALALLAPRAQAREYVAAPELGAYPAGSIVVRTSERRLYFVTGRGEAIRYMVGVGRAGRQWSGRKYVEELAVEPAWMAPMSIWKDKTSPPPVIPPGPNNPMGARVIGLGPGGEYAIHGTNDPSSIGKFVSYGCIRMFNEDVIDLFARVRRGTPVIVTR